MGVEWVSRIPSKISGRIKKEFSASLKKKYKMSDVENFSTNLNDYTDAVFPFVLIQMLPSSERAADLSGDSINAMEFSFQIDVTDNKSQERAQEIAYEILRIMKGIGFMVTYSPTPQDTKDMHRSIARYSREIASDDIL